MYRCKKCGWQTRPRQSELRLISERREMIYNTHDKKGNPITTHGWEIAKEIKVCGRCHVEAQEKETTEA